MALSAQVHSDGADGVLKTITLQATGHAAGHISIVDSAGSSENFDLIDVKADPRALRLTCKASVFFMNPDVEIAVTTAGGTIVAAITISHALFGNGTTEYPLRAGEDATLRTFLEQARFPRL